MAEIAVNLKGQDNLSKTVDNAKKSVDDLKRSTTELGKAEKEFERITESGKSLKAQLNQLKALMADMNMKGLSGSDEFTRIAEKAGEIKDAMTDASDAVNRFSSDTQNLDAAIQAIQGIAAAGAIATGAMALLGTENEKVEQAILKVQAALGILNGVQAIANTLNKDSALMQRIKAIRLAATTREEIADTVATTANSAATTVNTAATAANTVAQKAWNVAKAIGKAMFGDFTGLVLLGIGAVAAYAIATNEATDAENARNKALEDGKRMQEERSDAEQKLASSVANSAAQQIASYMRLQQKWKECGGDVKKQEKFMSDYKVEIKNTGFALNSLSDAENFFVKNTDTVIAAITARAKAQANYELMVERLKKGLELAHEKSVRSGAYYTKATTQNLTEEEIKLLDKQFGNNKWRETTTTYSSLGTSHRGIGGANQQALNYINEQRRQEAIRRNQEWQTNTMADTMGDVNAYLKGWQEANAEADRLLRNANLHSGGNGGGGGGGHNGNGSYGGGHSGSGHNTPKVDPPKKDDEEKEKPKTGSIEEMEQEVAQLQKALRWDLVDEDKVETAKQRIAKLQKDIKEKKVELGFEDPKPVENSLTDLKDKLSKLQKKLNDGLIPEEDIEKTKEEIRQLQDQIEKKELELKIKPIAGTIEDYQDQIKEIEKQLAKKKLENNVRLELNQKKDELQRKVDELTNGKVTIKALVKPTYINEDTSDDQRKSYENAQEKISQFENDYKRRIITLKEFKEKAREVNREVKDFKMKPIELNFKTNFDELMEKIKKGFDVFDSISSVVTSVETLSDKIKDNANAWEILVASVQVAESVLNSITTAITLINALTKITSSSKLSETASTQAATTAQIEKATVDTASIAPTEAATLALKAQEAAYMDMAAAAIFAAHASIPFAGVGIAAGLVSAMMAAMAAQHAASAAMSAFKDGGIVGGSTYEHPILAHRGEMILNGKQQKRLFDILDNGGAIGGGNQMSDVKFVLRGSDLYGSFHNYTKIKSKVGKQIL